MSDLSEAKKLITNAQKIQYWNIYASIRRDVEDENEWLVDDKFCNSRELLYRSNHEAALKVLSKHGDDEYSVYQGCIVVRAIRDNKITPIFETLMELYRSYEGYPVLDDDDYDNKRYHASLEAIRSEYRNLVKEDAVNWEVKVYDWLARNDSDSIEPGDDGISFPDEQDVVVALRALNLLDIEEEEETKYLINEVGSDVYEIVERAVSIIENNNFLLYQQPIRNYDPIGIKKVHDKLQEMMYNKNIGIVDAIDLIRYVAIKIKDFNYGGGINDNEKIRMLFKLTNLTGELKKLSFRLKDLEHGI